MLTASLIAQSQQSDEDAVRVPLEQYMQAHATGNGELIKQAFTPEAKIQSIGRDGTLAILSRDEFAARFTGKPADDESRRKRRIESVDITGTTAIAKLVLDYPAVKFTDYMSLLKVNGEWKIASKIFHAQRRGSQ
jgi:hypothetical protein